MVKETRGEWLWWDHDNLSPEEYEQLTADRVVARDEVQAMLDVFEGSIQYIQEKGDVTGVHKEDGEWVGEYSYKAHSSDIAMVDTLRDALKEMACFV